MGHFLLYRYITMCGLVGYATLYKDNRHSIHISKLFMESSIRGLHAFGCAYWHTGGVDIAKYSTRENMQRFITTNTFEDVIIHSRYSTSGDWHDMRNNQPLCVGGYHLAFNGVISMMTKLEMEQEHGVALETDNDGELFIHYLMRNGDNAAASFIANNGSFAGLWYNPDGVLYAIRNEHRPLWYVLKNGYVYYASTRDIIMRALGIEAYNQSVQCEPYRLYNLEDQLNESPY